jgi:cell division protein FtsN
MDQDTSNGPGKASWREKLGLGAGAKDMPKIANEFKAARTNLNAEPKPLKAERAERVETAERPQRPKPQPVARPAPMAPRPQAQAKAPQQAGNPLAERLKAQRQAAEKLAEQRILAARAASAEPKPAEKPKFTFAEEEIAQAKREVPAEPKRDYQPVFAAKPATGAPRATQSAPPSTSPQLVPPRPALGGERPIAPPPSEAKPQAAGLQSRFQAPPQPSGYRPLDPPTYQGRQPPAAPPPRPVNLGNGAFAENRNAPPRGYDSYRRRAAAPQDPAAAEEEPYYGARSRRTAPPPARARKTPAYDDDLGDVFEDEPPPRRRASAQDYHQAYRDYDEGYEQEERRRSSGPWLVALILFIVAVLATAGWYYLYYMKPGQLTSAEVPVVAAPEKPAKTAPEPVQPTGSTLGTSGAGNQSSLEAAPERRKQIYDRVLGEESIEGNQIVPTQEPPQQVEPAGDQPQQQIQGTLPKPNAQGNSGAGTSESTDPLPLPLPPPPGSSGQQGNLSTTLSQQTASLTASDNGSQPIAEPASASDVIAPVPGEADDAAKTMGASQSASPAIQKPAVQPAEQAKSMTEPVDDAPPAQAVAPAPVKPKAKARVAKTETKKKVVAAVAEQAPAEPQPMVLVPPSEPQSASEPAATSDQITASDTQAEKKSGSFFSFLGNGDNKRRPTGKSAEQPDFSSKTQLNAGPQPVTEAATQDTGGTQQVATVSPDDQQAQPLPMPAPEAAETKKQGGFLAQLASYRSEAEALAEYDRLRSKYGDVVGGLSPQVTKASVSGTTRYRLGVGPVASREAAARICNSLIAAGERDCLVRGN